MAGKMGRRTFVKNATSAFLGLATVPLLGGGQTYAKADKSPTLEYRTLGKTGLKVTAVSMGAMNCSDPAVLRRAFDLGVNFFDTARVYMGGRNEGIVGKVFRGKRDKVFIQTKVKMGETEKQNRESVETSLKSLQTDYVDVLLAHSMRTPEDVSDPKIVEFLKTMKKEGKARFTGISTHTDMATLLKAAVKANCHDVVLTSYNFTHANDLKEAIAEAAQAGIGIVAMKTQAGGYKSANMGGLNPHQAALKYVISDRNVSNAIPGVTTIEQIEECVAVMGTAFSRNDSDTLQEYDAYLAGRICTMCGACSGECEHGVNYADCLRAVMYHDGYRDRQLVQAVLSDRELLEKGKRCSECTSCSVTCERGVDIRAQMEWVRNVLV